MQHIEQTLADIDQKILTLENLRSAICVELLGATRLSLTAAVAATHPSPEPAVKALKLGRNTKVIPLPPEKPARRPYTRKTSADSGLLFNPSVIGAVSKLPQPFTIEVLVSNGICANVKQACNYTQRAKAKGWLELVGRGLWQRTVKFGRRPQAAGSESSQERTLAGIKAELGVKSDDED